jgi:DNA-binding HxlR family transcriptional regulator
MTDIPLKRRSPVSLRDCNLSKSFELIGDRWTLLILRSALYGLQRFDDFQADLDVPRSVLSNRLAGLVDSGIMERREYREGRQCARIEYPLTRMGQALGTAVHGHGRMGRQVAGRWDLALDVAVEVDGSEAVGCAGR